MDGFFKTTRFHHPLRMPLYYPDTEPAGGDPAGDQEKAPASPTLDELLKDPTFKAAYDEHQRAAVEAAKSQWEKEKGLTPEQLAEQKDKEREESLTKREGEVARKEMRNKALEELSGKKLPASLVDALDLTDDKTIAASLTKVEAAFRDSVKASVAEQLKGDPPKAGGAAQPTSTMKDAIKEKLYGETPAGK